MDKKELDEKYSYQIDEHNVVHLFRGEDDCQQYLTNPLLGAIFKIEKLEATNKKISDECHKLVDSLEKKQNENAELKNRDCWKSCEYANPKAELIGQHIKDVQNLTKAKELLNMFLRLHYNPIVDEHTLFCKVEQFLKDSEVEK